MANSGKSADKIFPITTFISELPTNLIQPASSKNGPSVRLVIVGDVHGMRKSLEALLDKVGFDKCKGDHLIFVGDLINNGPDSSGVVDLAITLGASAVRGNHEDAVLNEAAEINATKESPLDGELSTEAVPASPEANLDGDTVQSLKTSNSDESAVIRRTAMALSTRHLDWLAALPLGLRIELPHHLASSVGHSLIVAHAGLVPGIQLEEQDPYALLQIRSLVSVPGDEVTFQPTKTLGEESWVGAWDRWQDGLASKTTVIFGHDARRGLQLGKYAIGLDSGCLYGNQLSAVVIAVSDTGIDHQIIQVECVDTPLAK